MIIVAWLEEDGHIKVVPWKRLAEAFGAELHLINEHHRHGFQSLEEVIDLYSHKTWVRLVPYGGEDLRIFKHPETDDVVYFVGPDAKECPAVSEAFDVTIPAKAELHAYTAMAIALWDRYLFRLSAP